MISALRRECLLYLTAQGFLSRLPIPVWVDYEPGRLATASRYFPLVGVVLGGITALVWVGASLILPAPVAAGLAIATSILLTGALHEDGFADCCDGLGGGFTKDRALEIMRDSRIGVYGAAGLIIVIGLRWQILAGFELWHGAAAILVAMVGGRLAILPALYLLPYARVDGAARDTAQGASTRDLIVANLIAAAIAAALALSGEPYAVGAMLCAFMLGALWAGYLKRRLGGYTGDGLGAAEQLGQIVALLVMAAA